MLVGIITMFASAFSVAGDGPLGLIIACRRCEWKGVYAVEPHDAGEGNADGGEPYTDEELDHMRTLEALETAAEDHLDHMSIPGHVSV